MTTSTAEEMKTFHKVLGKLLTAREVAALFRRSELTVGIWKKDKGLPCIVITGDERNTIRFELQAVRRWARDNGKKIYKFDNRGRYNARRDKQTGSEGAAED